MLTDEIASRHLGKKSSVSEFYDQSLLVCVPRYENRVRYNIDRILPFEGFDVWHAYEFSTLTKNNVPVTEVLKIKYSCESKYIIESKSLKLYLNSFNMSQFGNSREECLSICKNLIEKDLSEKLETTVEINFLTGKRVEILENFENIMNFVNEKDLKIESFKESPQLLKTEEKGFTEEYYLKFNSLRSNCRVTHQPDFGDVYIYYKSKKHIDESSLIKYLVSFRSEYHFHEECCEMIFKRLYDLLDKFDELMVCALYTRRGGIDICPVRMKNYSSEDIEKLLSTNIFARAGIKQ